jgi:ankyrin repeat protein
MDYQLTQQVMLAISQNRKVWQEIHYCIRTNDIEQLMALLSKHTIDLNSFRLWDGDTILHSAARSNSVAMMQFILQRISPRTKQWMMRMKNPQLLLPSDLVTTTWQPSIHSLFPLKLRQVVEAVLMLGAKRQDGTPYYPQTHFYKLPKDVLFLILQYAVCYSDKPGKSDVQEQHISNLIPTK